jgi:hypothetical protein
MLYANGFLASGSLAAIVALAACFSLADRADAARAKTAARDAERLDSADVAALQRLSDELDRHLLWRDKLAEPDAGLGELAEGAAAAATTASIRQKLLALAGTARRSALEFLVEYNLAAGAWQKTTGLTMRQPMLLR